MAAVLFIGGRLINVLIVYAHPDPRTFGGKLKYESINILKDLGYAVQVSDLYSMNWQAVASQRDFIQHDDDPLFNLQHEQAFASRNGTFSPDILREQEKILWADYVLFQFPLWWYTMPAIMKGWVDRVLAYGFAYGEGHSLVGRRTMLVVTTGGPTRIYTTELRESMIDILDPIQRRILYFCGMQVLPPFAVYGANNATEGERGIYLNQYRQLLQVLPRIMPIDYK